MPGYLLRTRGVPCRSQYKNIHTRFIPLRAHGQALQVRARRPAPVRSPDLNVLDLYVWRVLERGVWHHRPKTIERAELQRTVVWGFANLHFVFADLHFEIHM